MIRLEKLEEERIEWETRLLEVENQLKLIDEEIKSIEELEELVETLNETFEKINRHRDVYARDEIGHFCHVDCAQIDKDGDVILSYKDEE